MIMIGLLVAGGFFVDDVWIKYQAKDTNIKISAKDLKNEKNYTLQIDREDVQEEISEIIDFEVIMERIML